MCPARDLAQAPVAELVSFTFRPAVDVPRFGLVAGELHTFGHSPGAHPGGLTQVDVRELLATFTAVLDAATIAATGQGLRVRVASPDPMDDGRVIADYTYQPPGGM